MKPDGNLLFNFAEKEIMFSYYGVCKSILFFGAIILLSGETPTKSVHLVISDNICLALILSLSQTKYEDRHIVTFLNTHE